jgi:hypothetical protein
MNSVSSAVGSKVFTTSLLPPSILLAAVKPEPVSSLKRLSASATAPGSAGLLVPRIAGMIHHDLDCHRISCSVSPDGWNCADG